MNQMWISAQHFLLTMENELDRLRRERGTEEEVKRYLEDKELELRRIREHPTQGGETKDNAAIRSGFGNPAKDQCWEIVGELWNDDIIQVTSDGLSDSLHFDPDFAENLIQRLWHRSDYWAEQIVRTVAGLPSGQTEDFESLLVTLKSMNCGKTSAN